MQKPTPAPIFNHRKRPRQAMFADPQNDVMPGPSGAASVPSPPRPKFSASKVIMPYGKLITRFMTGGHDIFITCPAKSMHLEPFGLSVHAFCETGDENIIPTCRSAGNYYLPDLMPPQGFGRGRNPTAVPQQRSQALARSGSNTDAMLIGYRNTQTSPANSSGRGGFQKQLPYGHQSGSSSTLNSGGRGRGNSSNFNSRSQTSWGFQTNRQQTYPASFTSGQSMSSSRNPGPGPYGDMGQQQRGLASNFGNQRQQNSRGRGFSRNYTVPDRGFRDDTQFHSTTNVNFGGGEEFSNSSNDTINADGQSKPSTSAVAAKKPSNDFERSLHAITCTVAGMRRWNKFRDNIQLVFEVYGYVNSAITKQGHDCKEFLLRDDRKDAVKCLFYEVDRQLPKLTRGQRIRCVGNLDTKTEVFKLMSVRPSQEVEREIYKTLVSRSDQLMHRITKKLREF